MADGVTVDANVIKSFNDDFLADFESASRILVEKIVASRGFVVDEGGKIKHEWLETCQGPFLKEWYFQQIKVGVIRFVRPAIGNRHKKALIQGHGFPRRGFDLAYVAVANVTEVRYIVTEDMDFFDPSLKPADAATKLRAKKKRNGPVCSYLRKTLRITVGTVAHALSEL